MNITSENYQMLAAKAYQPVCLSQEEFVRDIRAMNYIKSDIVRYQKVNSKLNLRIIINRFVVASNNFSPVDAMKFLFYVVRSNESHIVILKTIFTFLEIMPEILMITSELTVDDKFNVDETLLKELKADVKI